MKAKPKKPSKEADRFRDMVKKLLAVPKKEVDKQKALYERKKNQLKEKRAT